MERQESEEVLLKENKEWNLSTLKGQKLFQSRIIMDKFGVKDVSIGRDEFYKLLYYQTVIDEK